MGNNIGNLRASARLVAAVLVLSFAGCSTTALPEAGPSTPAPLLSPAARASGSPQNAVESGSVTPGAGAQWPGALILRNEPGGEPIVVPGSPAAGSDHRGYTDEAGDERPGPGPLVDLVALDVNPGCYSSELCAYFTIAAQWDGPVLDPAREWVAYGLVIDTDGDGVGDLESGIADAQYDVRVWQTDLHTGRTVKRDGLSWLGDREVEGSIEWFDKPSRQPMQGWVGGYLIADPLLRFYVWGAIIRDGRVVSVDYAPSAGWIDATPG